MKNTFTTKLFTAVFAMVFAIAGSASAQDAGEPLGDDFIFFVNGANTLVPAFDGSVSDDPLDDTNKVLQFNYGNWSYQGFRFETGGADLTANADSNDVLHLRLLVDPANQGQPNVTLMFEDKNDGSGADDGTADLPFRLQWLIPEEFRDGQWRTLEIPLPPRTWQELDDAKTAGTLDSLAANWTYGGAWSTGGFGVALDGMGPNSGERPDLWQEFEWSNVQVIGMFWDNNTGGGNVWIDDVYIGQPGLDLSVADGPAGAMSGVTFGGSTEGNTLTWAENSDFGGYNVYFSENPITDITGDGVALLQNLTVAEADGGMFMVNHRLEVPHESLAPLDVYYAVTSLSQFGVENPDITASNSVIANADLPVQPAIIQLTEDEGNTLFDNLSAGNVTGEGFPDFYRPFVLDANHSQLSETVTLPDNDADNSGTFWVGYTDLNELWIYAEVLDDNVSLATEATPPSDAWMFDSIEMGFGNYDVRDVEGGSTISGSPHIDMLRGEFADYQFRISAHTNTAGEVVETFSYVGWSIEQAPPGSGTAYDVLMDDAGNTIGYKVLSLFPLDAIQSVDQGDAVLDPPASNEIRLIPMTLTLNDNDGEGRAHQITWSLKNNVNNQWWNTPAQWATVAMVGRDLVVASSIETIDTEVPQRYSLDQNYPNPFNPNTTIRFALSQPDAVRLTVYDLLGREVATLVNGEQLTAGTHEFSFDASELASGLYMYRLETNAFTQTRQMMLLK